MDKFCTSYLSLSLQSKTSAKLINLLQNVWSIQSQQITEQISHGDLSEKPGWVRLSLHPTMTNEEIYFVTNTIKNVIENISVWSSDYEYYGEQNEFFHKNTSDELKRNIESYFDIE